MRPRAERRPRRSSPRERRPPGAPGRYRVLVLHGDLDGVEGRTCWARFAGFGFDAMGSTAVAFADALALPETVGTDLRGGLAA